MSYCRFSTDDFACDVYVYEDVEGGYTTHVAGNRVVFDTPLPDPVPWDSENPEPWFERFLAVSRAVDYALRVPIGGPYDGATYRDPTPGACADTLERLRAAGYRVPQGAIDALREEDADLLTTERKDGEG